MSSTRSPREHARHVAADHRRERGQDDEEDRDLQPALGGHLEPLPAQQREREVDEDASEIARKTASEALIRAPAARSRRASPRRTRRAMAREMRSMVVGPSWSEGVGRAPGEAGERAGIGGGVERARAVGDEQRVAGDARGPGVLGLAKTLGEVARGTAARRRSARAGSGRRAVSARAAGGRGRGGSRSRPRGDRRGLARASSWRARSASSGVARRVARRRPAPRSSAPRREPDAERRGTPAAAGPGKASECSAMEAMHPWMRIRRPAWRPREDRARRHEDFVTAGRAPARRARYATNR